MGLRVRLKASFDISLPAPGARRPAGAQAYGMILADNGSNWYISGAPDPRLEQRRPAHARPGQGHDFEVVDTHSLQPGS